MLKELGSIKFISDYFREKSIIPSQINSIHQIYEFFVNVKDKIVSNRREKADVIFANNYSFLLKTLLENLF